MPLYDYQCSACKHVTEVRHGFDETYDGKCEKCGGTLTRVFNPAPILFKGSGFYVTDSRSASSKGEAKSESKSETPKSDSPSKGPGESAA